MGKISVRSLLPENAVSAPAAAAAAALSSGRLLIIFAGLISSIAAAKFFFASAIFAGLTLVIILRFTALLRRARL